MTQSTSPSLLASLSNDISRVASLASASTVRVHARRGPAASGVVWRAGLIVTADEAIETADNIHVTLADGTRVAATLAGRDATTDLALLRCDAATTPIASHAGPATLGQMAVVMGQGRHGGQAALAMISAVSGPWQSMRGGKIEHYIGLDMRFERHLEGAALLDADGALMGMVAAGPRQSSLAIPAVTIERVAAQLLARGHIARGYLGLGLQPVHIEPVPGSTDKRHGIMVVSVDDRGPGRTAGVLQGDILVAWNGEPVGHMRDMMRKLGSDAVGTSVDLALQRAGQPASARLTIGERPTT